MPIHQKKINRNAFNEKLLHRFLFEAYYGINSEPTLAKTLMPPKHRWADLNLVVPEDAKAGHGFRPDLVLHFRDGSVVPIEVKWKIEGNTGLRVNQGAALTIANGAYASLTPDLTSHDGIPHIPIPQEPFRTWLKQNVGLLTDDMLSSKGLMTDAATQHWLVALRGQAPIENWNAMLASTQGLNPFWAFRNDRRGVADVMRIRRGDVIHMLFVQTPGHRMAVSNDLGVSRKIPFLVAGSLELEVSTPYFIPPAGQRPYDVFQPDAQSYCEMKWPHYIDFAKQTAEEVRPQKKPTRYGAIGDLGDEFVAAFVHSCNTGGGMPSAMSPTTAEMLAGKLRT